MALDPVCTRKTFFFKKSLKVFSPQTIYFQPIAGISIVILSTVVLLVNANGGGGYIKMQMMYAEVHSQHFIILPENITLKEEMHLQLGYQIILGS